jgi:hypothetical protein
MGTTRRNHVCWNCRTVARVPADYGPQSRRCPTCRNGMTALGKGLDQIPARDDESGWIDLRRMWEGQFPRVTAKALAAARIGRPSTLKGRRA